MELATLSMFSEPLRKPEIVAFTTLAVTSNSLDPHETNTNRYAKASRNYGPITPAYVTNNTKRSGADVDEVLSGVYNLDAGISCWSATPTQLNPQYSHNSTPLFGWGTTSNSKLCNARLSATYCMPYNAYVTGEYEQDGMCC